MGPKLLTGLVGQHQDAGSALAGVTGLFHDILDIALAETVDARARRSCGKVIVPWMRRPGRSSPNSASDKVFAQDTGRLFRVFAENSDRRQLVLLAWCPIEKSYRNFSTWGAMPRRENSPSKCGNLSSAPPASSSPNSSRSAACSYRSSSYPSGSMTW